MRLIILMLSSLTFWSLCHQAMAWDEVGKARLKVGPFPIYSCVLLTPSGDYTPDKTPVRLELTYKRNIRSHHFLKHARKEWAHQGLPEALIEANAKSLADAFPDIKKGETLSIQTGEDGSGSLFHNGEKIFHIEDPELVQSFINIWLSEKTSRPKHREKLIGER